MARRSNSLKSPTGIARYCNVFTARARKGKDGKPDGDPKFSILLVFDRKADLSEMEEAVEEAAVAKFGTKARDLLAKNKLGTPIRDASDYVDEDADDDENYPFNLPGAKMVRFSTKDQPGVVDQDAEPLMDKFELYDGCKARVSYRVFAYDTNGNKGVSVALINVQKMGDGKRLSGNPSAEDDFKEDKPKGRSKPKSRSSDVDDLL